MTASVPLAVAENEEGARRLAAGWLLAYLTSMGPLYPRILRDQFGFAREVDALLEANANGSTPQLPADAEPLAREVTVMATYDDAPEAVRQWLEAGADAIDLVLPPGVAEEQLHEMLEAAAPAASGSARERGNRGPPARFRDRPERPRRAVPGPASLCLGHACHIHHVSHGRCCTRGLRAHIADTQPQPVLFPQLEHV